MRRTAAPAISTPAPMRTAGSNPIGFSGLSGEDAAAEEVFASGAFREARLSDVRDSFPLSGAEDSPRLSGAEDSPLLSGSEDSSLLSGEGSGNTAKGAMSSRS